MGKAILKGKNLSFDEALEALKAIKDYGDFFAVSVHIMSFTASEKLKSCFADVLRFKDFLNGETLPSSCALVNLTFAEDDEEPSDEEDAEDEDLEKEWENFILA